MNESIEGLKRTKRSTAGNRYRQALAKDLDEAEKEFFSNTYGGFNEAADDDDFKTSSSSSDESISSSSEEEEDEVAGEEPEKEKKKKKIVYKEPVKNKLTGVKNKPKPRPKPKQVPASEANSNSRKSVRQSTIDKRYDPNEEKMEMKRKKSTKRVRQFTQEQLLQEAMKTESINLSQLVIYQQEEQQR